MSLQDSNEDMMTDQEALARFLNQISQTETHFDSASKKVQDAYRNKAGFILEWIAARRLKAPQVVGRKAIAQCIASARREYNVLHGFKALPDYAKGETAPPLTFAADFIADKVHALQLPQPSAADEVEELKRCAANAVELLKAHGLTTTALETALKALNHG